MIENEEKYLSFNWPGIDAEVVQWLIEKKASMIGSDASGDPPNQRGVHSELIMKNGIFNLEFMTFEELLADEVHEFLFILYNDPVQRCYGFSEPFDSHTLAKEGI